jgi:hypothetical protein
MVKQPKPTAKKPIDDRLFFAVGFGCKGSRIKAQDSRKLQATSRKA